jgi:16S rRNA (guanine966-N2)-methyltransferase
MTYRWIGLMPGPRALAKWGSMMCAPRSNAGSTPAALQPWWWAGRRSLELVLNQVRIIAGEWRSRIIKFPDAPGLRPTGDRLRGTLFNWLGQDMTGQVCLDLFAGSGALGFEALSRGAKRVVMVERDARARQSLLSNAQSLKAGARLEVLGGDALQFLRDAQEQFDVVFCDPPFGSSLLEEVLPQVPRVLLKNAMVYAESGHELQPGQQWQLVKSTRAGAVYAALIQATSHEP